MYMNSKKSEGRDSKYNLIDYIAILAYLSLPFSVRGGINNLIRIHIRLYRLTLYRDL